MLFDAYGDFIICDGAMGTMLQKRGLKMGERSDIMNMTAPQVVEDVHRMYVEAGSDIIYTNTLGANAIALNGTGYSPGEVITAAVGIAKRASAGAAMVALDIGPTGVLMEPLGDLGAERAYELFKEQALAGWNAGADFVIAETMSDIAELKAAIQAVTENTDLPVVATMTFDITGQTYLGCMPEDLTLAARQQRLVAAVGLNCSLAPAEMMATAERIAKSTDLPMIIKPNAGLPDSATGLYSIGPAEFAAQMKQLVDIATNSAKTRPESRNRTASRRVIVGGCCGTTPDYIRELKKVFTS